MDDFLAYPLDEKPVEPRLDFRSLRRFRSALEGADGEAFDDLFKAANEHWELSRLAGHITPLEFSLIAILIEQHKEIQKLSSRIDEIRRRKGGL